MIAQYAEPVIRPLRCTVCDDVLPNIAFVSVDWISIGMGGDQNNPERRIVHNRDECINVVLEWARRETWDGKLRAVHYEHL